ncbi:MAG TPA: hypothetical protein VE908_09275 [Mycobacterium sp.]|nr:hypothetical protein [Mycobacterium sp.]
MTNDALMLVERITAQGTSEGVNQMTLRLQEIQAIGAVATTIGVLTALYIAVIRDPRKASQEHVHHLERMNALHRVHTDRIEAQARKVVPSCGRIPMFGDSWWTVRIDNASNTMSTMLAVDVKALDTNGFEVSGGCRPADRTVPFDQAFDRAVRAARSESPRGQPGEPGDGHQPGSDLLPVVKQAIRDTLAGHLVRRWPRALSPNQYAVMAYTTTDPSYELCITIDYEDHEGYQWRRTDTSQPTRMDNESLIGRRAAATQ